MRIIRTPLIIATAASVMLTGCLTKEDLGLGRRNPDEFSVVKRAPLEVPKDFTLPKPTPGAARPQEESPEQAAKKALLGKTVQPATTSSSMEQILLQQSGATDNDPDIRQKVNAETQEYLEHNIPVADKLLNTVGADRKAKASVVDAEAEAQRIRENQQKGTSVLNGETPTVEK